MTAVRSATPADVEGVAAVVRDVWADKVGEYYWFVKPVFRAGIQL